MKTFIFFVGLSLAAGQEFQQTREFNTAVRLARPGFFQQRGASNSASFQSSDNQFQGISSQSGSNNFQNQNANTLSSSFSSSSSSVNNNNNNQFQSNSFSSRNREQFQSQPIQQNQQTSFSSANRQQGTDNQFQSNSFTSSSPQINSGSTFQNNQQRFGSQFQTSSNQGSTGSRLNPINIQLTPSTRFQSTPNQQITGTSLQTGNNRFQQANFNQQNIGSSSQPILNNQFSSGNRQQSNNLLRSTSSSSSSSSTFTDSNEGPSGVFEPLNLPSGASLLLGNIATSFTCVDRPYGYYADQENSCRVFHVCNPALFSNGEIQTYQYSFMCAEGTVFDQNEMSCKMEFDALPCDQSSSYYFRNEEFGRPEEKSF